MQHLILRNLQQSELGWFAEYRRLGKETSKQRAINFDSHVVDQVFPLSKKTDIIPIRLKYRGDNHLLFEREQYLKKQGKNWRLTGDKIDDHRFSFVEPGDLFVLVLDNTGEKPSGCFDIISGKDGFYLRLLSLHETSDLVKHGMIARDKTDSSSLLDILNQYDEELFPYSEKQNKSKEGKNKKMGARKKTLIRPPNPARAMNIFANLGHSLKVAVADLIDNSIAAGATRIDILFPPPIGNKGRHLVIADNGNGMDEDELLEALTIGSIRDYEKHELGKFGIGMKAASFSQTKVLSVSSKKQNGMIHMFCWDLNLIQKADEWKLVIPDLDDWEKEYLEGLLKRKKSGTVILWSDMTTPKSSRQQKKIDQDTAYGRELLELSLHLEMIFHRFLSGDAKGYKKLQMTLNQEELKPWDPFLSDHEYTISLDGFTVPVMGGDDKEHHVTVNPYVLPPTTSLNDEERKRAGHNRQWNDMQGFYVYRADRIIHAGDWCGLWVNDEHVKLSRVGIDFDPSLDEAFDINVAKMEVKLPAILGDQLKTKLKEARKEARLAYKNANKKPKRSGPTAKKKGNTSKGLKEDITGKKTGAVDSSYTANDEQLALLLEEHRLELKKLDKNHLWKVRKDLQGKEIITLNANHEFSKILFEASRLNPVGQEAISLFLSSLENVIEDSEMLQELLISEIENSKE